MVIIPILGPSIKKNWEVWMTISNKKGPYLKFYISPFDISTYSTDTTHKSHFL